MRKRKRRGRGRELGRDVIELGSTNERAPLTLHWEIHVKGGGEEEEEK